MFSKRAQIFLDKAGITIGGDKPYDVRIYDSSIYRDVLLKGTLGLGDGYTNGKWDCEALDVFFDRVLRANQTNLTGAINIINSVRDTFINTQVGKRAFEVGEQHYDLGNDMYELMLGESMGYSSGLFEKDTDTLEEVQYRKFDALCKKLKLEPGMKILEIGAGWGTFARHAAKHYGAQVIGLTVSKEQKAFAEKRCEGLPVEFILLDYQKLPKKFHGYFDRVVSIEMIEAVGKKNFDIYFQTIEKALKPDGLLGLQAIIGSGNTDPFISTRIFPNGILPSIFDIAKTTKDILRVKEWQSFGKDYDKTLMMWDENFRMHWHKIREMKNAHGKDLYDDKFYRMWRYYLLCCAGLFRSGTIDVAQIIFSKENGLSTLK